MDLSKLSDQDLAALQSGDMSKVSDAGLAAISQPEPPQEPSLTGGSVRSLMDLIRPGFSQGAGHGAVQAASLGNVNPSEASDDVAGHALGRVGGTVAMAAASPASAAESAGGRILGNAGINAAQGFLQKPEGDDTLGARTGDAVLGGLIGGAAHTIGEAGSALLKGGAKASKDISDIKSGEMATRAQDAINSAADDINNKVVAPASDKLKSLLQGETFQINPDRVKPTFPRLGEEMEYNLSKDAANQGLEIAGGPKASVPLRADISGTQALHLKQAADDAANWQRKIGVGDADAVSKEADASALGNILRRQINSDPERAGLNQNMEDAISLRNALTNKEATSPIETLTAKPGTSRGAIVDQVDNMAGTGLRGLGHDIDRAKSLLIDPGRVHDLVSLVKEIGRVPVRGAVEGAALANKGAQALGKINPITLQQALSAAQQTREP